MPFSTRFQLKFQKLLGSCPSRFRIILEDPSKRVHLRVFLSESYFLPSLYVLLSISLQRVSIRHVFALDILQRQFFRLGLFMNDCKWSTKTNPVPDWRLHLTMSRVRNSDLLRILIKKSSKKHTNTSEIMLSLSKFFHDENIYDVRFWKWHAY